MSRAGVRAAWEAGWRLERRTCGRCSCALLDCVLPQSQTRWERKCGRCAWRAEGEFGVLANPLAGMALVHVGTLVGAGLELERVCCPG